jgi:arsenite methyltransferase
MDYLEAIGFDRPEQGELYDELPLWSAPFGLMMLERVPTRTGATILDVGAGTGFLTVELAQRCGAAATVIAVDPWRAAVTRLRRKLEFLGLGNVRVLEQDAATLEMPDASVDLIVSNLGINNFDHPDAVLKVCRRVLKPDGRLFLTTNLMGHMREFYDVYRSTLVALGMTDRLPALDAHVQHRGTVDSVGRLLADAGFETLAADTASFRMRFADGSSLFRHYFIRLGFLPAWKAVVPAEAVERTFEALEKNLNALAAEQGELALTIPVACFEARKAANRDRAGC